MNRYIAIGLDIDQDVVTNEIALNTADEAIDTLRELFDNVVVHHVIELDVPDAPPDPKVVTTKLQIA